MIYANPIPAELASGWYYGQIAREYYLSPAKLDSDYAPVRFERELKIFRKHRRTGAVLDVGCSSGAFLFQLRQRFPGAYNVLGTDVAGPPLDYAESRGVPVIRGNFLEESFGHQKFDAITFWAVLEHLAEPKEFVQKAAALLQPAGLCFVLVPNMKSLASRLLGRKYRYVYPQHVNYFTRETLLNLVARDFCVVEVVSTHFNPVVLWQDLWGRGAAVSNQQRAELLQRTTGLKQSRLLAPLKLLYYVVEQGLGALHLADNMTIVMRKKTQGTDPKG